MKITAKKEAAIWASCMSFGLAILLLELTVANARAHRADERAISAAEWQQTLAGISLPQDFDSADGWTQQAAPSQPAVAEPEPARALVSDLLVNAIVQVESSGNARMVGSQGERGLMQVKKDTWFEVTRNLFGRGISFDLAFEPDVNRQVGSAYLVRLQEFLAENRGQWRADERSLLFACYNAGPNRVKAAGFKLTELPESTRDYVKRASALHDYFLENNEPTILSEVAAQIAPSAHDS